MEDPLNYTYDGIERELNLLEIHLKEAPLGSKQFCQDCIDKHIQTIRGFALEGVGFTKNPNEINNFLETEKKLRNMKGGDYQKEGVKFSQEVRNIRKKLNIRNSDFAKKIEKTTKTLNTPVPSNILANKTHNSKVAKLNIGDEMVTYTELGMMNAGQFAAEGVRYLAETNATLMPYEKWVTVGGGIGLQALGLFWRGMPTMLKSLSLVAGSNLLAGGVVKMVKGTTPTVAAAKAVKVSSNPAAGGKFTGQPNGRVFGGKVTATNVPTQYARAGILAGAQAFESPEHADLIRVD